MLLCLAFGVRCQRILDNSPYPRHVDEETFLQSSVKMLKKGSLQPSTLNWPSLPLYLATGAHSLG